MDKYDVIVIGAGPGGYVAAIRCAQLGLKTACVDEWLNADGKPSPGGTCLNVGCIPSKALLESSLLYERVQNDAKLHGIKTGTVSLDLQTMMQRKGKVVSDLTGGIHALFKSNGVSLISGRGTLLSGKRVSVAINGEEATQEIAAEHIILAPGSVSRSHPDAPFDDQYIVDSSGALSFSEVPETLAIIGAGVIALELGSVWRRLGAKVTLVKLGKTLLPEVDQQIGRMAAQQYKKQGLEIRSECKVVGSALKDNRVELQLEEKGGESVATFDRVVVAIGRIPNTRGLFGDGCDIAINDSGQVEVDEKCRTSVEGIYAIGDAVRGPMLAHKGSEEGVMVAELIAGKFSEVNYDTIPSVIYTEPEVAWCGKSEQQLKEEGIEYNKGSFPFAANGRALAGGHAGGMIKVLSESDSDRIVGVHMVGPHVSELIAEAVIAMEMGGSSEDLALTMFAHPSLSESLHEAALDVSGNAIHKGRR